MVVLVLPEIEMAPATREDIALEHAVQLVRGGWTQRAMARTSDGLETMFMADDAVSFCLVGAFRRSLHLSGTSFFHGTAMIVRLGCAVRDASGDNASTVDWNDKPGRTQGEVIALLEGMRDGGTDCERR